jgi:hypothetical protein
MAKRKPKHVSLFPNPAFDTAVKKWNEEWERAAQAMLKTPDLSKCFLALPSLEPLPSPDDLSELLLPLS